MTIAERVLSAVAAPARRAPITASVGVSSVSLAEYSAADGDLTEMLETIIGHADHAMFDVKNRGGNAAIHIPATGS
jgi:GGDEF domain-containing protein